MTDPVKPLTDLAELRRLHEKATPMVRIIGAWGLIWSRVVNGKRPDDPPLMTIPVSPDDADVLVQGALDELATMRNALLPLLDELEALREAARRCERALELGTIAVHSPDSADLARWLSAREIALATLDALRGEGK